MKLNFLVDPGHLPSSLSCCAPQGAWKSPGATQGRIVFAPTPPSSSKMTLMEHGWESLRAELEAACDLPKATHSLVRQLLVDLRTKKSSWNKWTGEKTSSQPWNAQAWQMPLAARTSKAYLESLRVLGRLKGCISFNSHIPDKGEFLFSFFSFNCIAEPEAAVRLRSDVLKEL